MWYNIIVIVLLLINFAILASLFFFLEREQKRHHHFLRKVNETKEELTFIVHQLRSPLSNLRKYNEFLQGKEFGKLSFAQHEAINKVQIALGESLIVLDRLLARSRLDEGKVISKPALLSVREIVQGAVNAVMPIAEQNRQTVIINGNAQLFTDPLLLHGILDEIFSNAVRYTPEGGMITITITDKNASVEIEVNDTGIGISQAERPHIFEKFFRGERAKPMFAGNGLGLAFAKQFTEGLGGTIRFTSVERKGSTFTVTLQKKII